MDGRARIETLHTCHAVDSVLSQVLPLSSKLALGVGFNSYRQGMTEPYSMLPPSSMALSCSGGFRRYSTATGRAGINAYPEEARTGPACSSC